MSEKTSPSKRVEKIPISQIFVLDKYIVPIYQRNYAWKEKEIQQLIEDIKGWNSFDQKEEGSRLLDYHLGLLVVDKKEDNIYEVIDGQQRLTTLYLLFKALAEGKALKDISWLPSSNTRVALQYEAREKYDKSLNSPDSSIEENGIAEEISHGYKVIKNNLESFEPDVLNNFIKKFDSIFLIRVQVPPNIDLNHYFEIMNTRGEQLEPHQIAKANILRNIRNEKDRYRAAKVWEACSDMNNFLYKNFSRNLREEIFKYPDKSCNLKETNLDVFNQEIKNFSSLQIEREDVHRFKEQLKEKKAASKNLEEKKEIEVTLSSLNENFDPERERSLLEILEQNTELSITEQSPQDTTDNRGRHKQEDEFRSVLSFPNFLLQVNAIVTSLYKNKGVSNLEKTKESEEGDENEDEASLDDKNLLKNMEWNWRLSEEEQSATPDLKRQEEILEVKAKRFINELLRCRSLYDNFILKRTIEDDKWLLANPFMRYKPKNQEGEVREDPEESNKEGNTEGLNKQFMALQSALRITYTSPKTMHWITVLLKQVHEKEGNLTDLINLLEEYATDKLSKSDYRNKKGFEIGRIVFTYLDYLLVWRPDLLKDIISRPKNLDNWQFQFRNSIEHFYPRHADRYQQTAETSLTPSSQDSKGVVSEFTLWKNAIEQNNGDFENITDIFGNLALVTPGLNSRFSNALPLTKAKEDNYSDIRKQSPKLMLMAAKTIENKAWKPTDAVEHGEQMFRILDRALEEKQASNNQRII